MNLYQKLYHKYIKHIVNFICAVLFTVGYNYYFFNSDNLGQRSIFNIVILFLCFFIYEKNINIKLKEKKIPLIFSILLSCSLVFGHAIDKDPEIEFLLKDFNAVITLLGFIKFFEELFYIAFEKIKNVNTRSNELWKFYNLKSIFFIIWIIILLSWIPAYLVYFPGITSYDVGWQMRQIDGTLQFSKFLPPIHTFMYKCFLDLGNTLNIDGTILYVIVQLLFLSFVYARVIKLLINKKANNWIILGAVLFFTINPVIAIFSLEVAKDIYFSAFFTLFVLQVIKICDNPKDFIKSHKNWICYIIISVLMCLFKSEGICTYIVMIFVIVIYNRKNNIIKYIVLMMLPVVLYLSINSGLYPLLNIKEGKIAEPLSVPIQQITATTKKYEHELEDETLDLVDKFIGYENVISRYNYRITDFVKEKFNEEYFAEHKVDFIVLYFRLLSRYPMKYFTTFLSHPSQKSEKLSKDKAQKSEKYI